MSGTYEQLVDIETPEQAIFSYSIAGIGSRAAAALIDALICVGVLLALVLVTLVFLTVVTDKGAGSAIEQLTGAWALGLVAFLQFAILWGYYLLFEVLWDGQTPGKRRIGIRVVQDGGFSVSWTTSALRNIARAIDMQPALTYGVGVVAAAMSRSGKRLGDHIAGTIVVRERVARELPVDSNAARPRTPRAAGFRSAPAVSAALTDDEFALLDRFLERRRALDATRRAALMAQMLERFRDRLPAMDASPARRLVELHSMERAARERGVAAKGDVGASREAHAIVARGAERWRAFAALLARAQRRGLRALSEEEVSEFVARYRELAADLARLRTAAHGRESDALFQAGRLVAAGHNLLYRRNAVPLSAGWRFVTVEVPREIRRSAGAILLAAALLFGPALIAFQAVVSHPAVAADLLPPLMLDRAENGVVRDRTGGGYITISQLERPVMASRIIANNVQVTYLSFAAGVTAGVGTVFLLVYNGISIGAAIGLYHSKGIAHQILAFVAPHGVLELSAICIAGGAGLLLARAILLPGELTRREALVRQGRRALRLITASTILLLAAGSIEGLISPRASWPPLWKWLVSAFTALCLVFYLTRGRGAVDLVSVDADAYSA
ncbi:MAG TPA: stage II sporulation protein M [Gemmatimonadaceae bacterium]|nr:stage II sporulation protein M [Gemmatimonadaceae bacterium]